MYALIYNSFDYTNIKFITQPSSAYEEYAQEEEEAKAEADHDGDCIGLCLLEIKGDGNFQIGCEFDGDENVIVLKEWSIDGD